MGRHRHVRYIFRKVWKGQLDKVRECLPRHDVTQLRDCLNRTLLHYATTGDMVRLLLRAGVPLEHRDKYGCTALRICDRRHGRDAMIALLEAGADPNAADNVGQTLVFHTSDIESWRLLKRFGANVNMRDLQGRTPLHYLIWDVQVDTFVQLGADPGIPDRTGRYSWGAHLRAAAGCSSPGFPASLQRQCARSIRIHQVDTDALPEWLAGAVLNLRL